MIGEIEAEHQKTVQAEVALHKSNVDHGLTLVELTLLKEQVT